MRKRMTLGLIGAGLASLAASGLTMTSASADTAAQGGDAVLVGSDTLQFGTSFVADGDPAGDPNYNNGVFNRIFDYFATGDANGRFTVAGGVSGAPGSAGETVILRAGQKPVLRPNGSGKGIAALIADSSGGGGYDGLPTGSITMARMSRLPTKTTTDGSTPEDTSCDNTAGCGGTHPYEIANDTLGLAALKSGSNAVALDANQLWNIYNCTNNSTDGDYTHWNSSKIGGTSADTIVPVIPQSGSGTRTFFLATINAASGHTSNPSLGSCVKTAQEHDPTGITGQATYTGAAGQYNPADAIEPFSQARLNLLNAGYFANTSGTANMPAYGYSPNTIAYVTGTSPVTGQPSFSTTRAVFVVARQADVSVNGTAPACSNSAAPRCFVPGGTQTAVEALISGGRTSVFRNSSYAADLTAAGFTPKFQDCGIDPDDSTTSANGCVATP